MTSPRLHLSSTTASTTSRGETVVTITTKDRRPSYTPATTATNTYPSKNNKQAPSLTTVQTTWPKLPEVVRICNLPEYYPDDSFGHNAKRNEKYARARLVALREHQQILVGFLGHLLTIEQHQRSEEQLFAASLDFPLMRNNSTLAVFSPAAKATTVTEATRASRTDSHLDPTAAMVVNESESPCECQKRHHRRLQKRDVAIRAYQRAILDVWQTDQNMCYWLSDLSFTGVGVPWNDRPTSGVSNPELERMGILQSKLMDYSTAANSFVHDGGSSTVGGHSNGEPLRRPVALPDSSTLGDLHTRCSLVSQPVSVQELTKSLPRSQLNWSSEQHTIPIIRINSPELLFKPLPKLLDMAGAGDVGTSVVFPALSYRSSFASTNSATSMTSTTDDATVVTAATAATGLSGTTASTANNKSDSRIMTSISGKILPIFSTPLLSDAMRELVTSSAPITPPPAVPAPKRPRPPTFPILLPPPPVRTRANVKIVSTAFFPSVPSPSASALYFSSQIRSSSPTTAAALTWNAADAKLSSSSSTSSTASSLAPIHEYNPVHRRQDVHPFDSVPISSASAKDLVVSGMKDLKTDDHSATQPEMALPAPIAAVAVTTTPAKKSTKAPLSNATTPQTIPPEYLEDDDINEIEASVVIGYHLQSLGKANEFLFQFNKESRRSFGVLKRFEVARQVFERRVLRLYAGDGEGDDGGSGDDEYGSEAEADNEQA
ncbi:hypothetical protein BGZ95_005570 [Linnemannia exigua]|uniref:Uncharacterized protein n=1 Tax=Linnemannia exigua TaxID=604196 RepID=A0AAD4H141_9FUNG|nr:hypothetical protein BGZ95_005570 [Linnemannia exigua]